MGLILDDERGGGGVTTTTVTKFRFPRTDTDVAWLTWHMGPIGLYRIRNVAVSDTTNLNGPAYGFGRSLQAYAGTFVLPLWTFPSQPYQSTPHSLSNSEQSEK